MSIQSIIDRRSISSIVHFTTGDGLLGILGSRAVLPRSQLEDSNLLEFILQLNAPIRMDDDWLDYVNLSITGINTYYYNNSERKHLGVSWYVLDFSPDILLHDGVFFTNTNNIYKQVSRGQGADALEAMFSNPIKHDKGTFYRNDSHAENKTTCNQAEVLYPGKLTLENLQRVYARSEEEARVPRGQIGTFGFQHVPVVVDPTVFG